MIVDHGSALKTYSAQAQKTWQSITFWFSSWSATLPLLQRKNFVLGLDRAIFSKGIFPSQEQVMDLRKAAEKSVSLGEIISLVRTEFSGMLREWKR